MLPLEGFGRSIKFFWFLRKTELQVGFHAGFCLFLRDLCSRPTHPGSSVSPCNRYLLGTVDSAGQNRLIHSQTTSRWRDVELVHAQEVDADPAAIDVLRVDAHDSRPTPERIRISSRERLRLHVVHESEV